MYRNKLISLFLILLLSTAFIKTAVFPPPVYAQSQCAPGDIGCIVRRLIAQFSVAGIIADIATRNTEAECSDTLKAVSGNPKAADEHRAFGAALDCGLADADSITTTASVEENVEVSFSPDQDFVPKVDANFVPKEILSGSYSGPGLSSDSNEVCTGDDGKPDMRCYLDTYSYKTATETLRTSIEKGSPDKAYKNIDRAGVVDKLSPYLCGDKPCNEAKRIAVLQAAMRGYWYSAGFRKDPNVNLPIEDLTDGDESKDLAAMRQGIDVAIDPFLGFIHSKCVATGACSLDETYKTDVAFSTFPLKVLGELPIPGILLSCKMGISVDGIDTGLLCSTIVGPNYGSGQLSKDGLLWKQMQSTGEGVLHEKAWTMQFCGDNCEWAESLTTAEPCHKLGVNLASGGSISDFEHMARLQMGHGVVLVTAFDQWSTIVGQFNAAIGMGITPILRICFDNAPCAFSDVNLYINFINTIADAVDGDFYAIAGPNEPNTETWLGGEEEVPESYATALANYMNAVIVGVDRDDVKLLSPAFNMTYPGLEREIAALNAQGANFDGLYGIAGNAYNIGQRMSVWVDRLRAAGIPAGKPIVLTEAGAFLDQGDRGQMIAEIAEEVGILTPQTDIIAINFFNMFNNNLGFTFHAMTDSEFATISQACNEETPRANVITRKAPVYFRTSLNTFYNVPTEQVDDPDGELREIAHFQPQDPSAASDSATKVRGKLKSDPGSITTAADSEKRISLTRLPFKLAQECLSGVHQVNLTNYGPNDRTVDASTDDSIAGATLEGNITYAAADENVAVPQEVLADPNATSFNHTVSRQLDLQVNIHQKVKDYLLWGVHRSCGVAVSFLSDGMAKAFRADLGDGKTLATLPSTQTTFEYLSDSKGTVTTGKNPNGGHIALLSPELLGEKKCGAVPAMMLPFGACSGGASGISVMGEMMQIAQDAETKRIATSPWLRLASFENQTENTGLANSQQ